MILTTLNDFFSKKLIYFSKKKPNFEGFQSSYYSSRILRKLATILCKENVTLRKESEHRFSVNAIANHRLLKNVRICATERKILLPFFKNGAK